jgi:hypothetical protein
MYRALDGPRPVSSPECQAIDCATRAAAVAAAVQQIEDWLLNSGIQLESGPQRGGIAGWLDRDGRPEFVYLEITGYYLTAMAWLSSGAAGSAENIETASKRARLAAGWIAAAFGNGSAPPTRLYLSGRPIDWRNKAVFSFDLAMAARGIASASNLMDWPECAQTLDEVCGRLNRISPASDIMQSHEFVTGDTTMMPDRWSTRPGPHHLKAAAAVLRLPESVVGDDLAAAAQRTCDHWTRSFVNDAWPCEELHAVLYALEGMVLCPRVPGDLEAAERAFVRFMALQEPDGSLPPTVAGGTVRSDVLAQALRMGLLLSSRGYLNEPQWSHKLDLLTDALLRFIRSDGGVLFALDQPMVNTWCAMFAHQALYLRRCGDSLPPSAFELLV